MPPRKPRRGDIVTILPNANCMGWPIYPGSIMRIWDIERGGRRPFYGLEFMDGDRGPDKADYFFWEDEFHYDVFLDKAAKCSK